MPFVRTTKSNAYFKRFQTKFRRRREAKTDYYARKKMVTQDLNKYGTPKFRLVSRITNAKVIAQIVYSMHRGDYCICQATSRDLSKWGLTTGFTSYSAAYATGLLVARRLLTKLRLADMFKGTTATDGKDYDVSCDVEAVKASKRPFKAILDIGNCKATIGNRVFGVLKGACDGGLHVPHSVKRYPGYWKDEDTKKGEYNADVHRARIMGEHINNYMDELEGLEDDAEKLTLKKQFSKWTKCLDDAGCDTVMDLYKKVHDGIRKDPAHTKKPVNRQKPSYADARRTVIKTKKGEYTRDRKFTHAERNKALQMRIAIAKGEEVS